jgi:hypothetical protein
VVPNFAFQGLSTAIPQELVGLVAVIADGTCRMQRVTMAVFGDTFYWIAHTNPRDDFHEIVLNSAVRFVRSSS